MKITTILSTIVLGCSLMLTNQAIAQDEKMSRDEYRRMDSLETSYKAEELKSENARNDENLSDLKSEKKESKLKAKEAQRVERDAEDAARQSRSAYKTEKRAQKLRKQADKQAKKAAKARDKSNSN